MSIVELVRCLCGELMKKEEIIDGEIPVCWKCQCESNEELEWKTNTRRKQNE